MRFVSAARLAALVGVTTGLAGVSSTLSAQGSCNIDPNNPKELAIISIGFQRAAGMGAGDARTNAIRGVLRDLENKPERFSRNPSGHAYVLAQTLTLAALEPSIGVFPTRGQLGYTTSPEQAYPLVTTLDSLFGVMARAPECVGEVNDMRAGEVWLALTRRALEASNTGQMDTATYYAQQSMKLAPKSPYPHHVLAVVANARNDRAAALGHWRKVIELAGADTSMTDLKMQSQYYVAMTELDLARNAQGDEKRAVGRRAADAIKEYMAVAPRSADVSVMMQALAEAYVIAGDAAALPTIYKPMLEAPTQFDDNALAMGGVLATQADKTDDAKVLFEAALVKNPNNRDALRNLAATYHTKEQFSAMYKPLDQLRTIDPNNLDLWVMYAYAAQGQQKAAKAPAEKKAWTDSLVKYSNLADSLRIRVEVAGFARGAEAADLELQLENAGEQPASPTVEVEFLDASGNVVATDSKQAGPIAKGAKASVKLRAAKPGIMSYRYKPIK